MPDPKPPHDQPVVFPYEDDERLRADKERLLGQRGMVLWLYGLSGSGKSTIARAAHERLLAAGRLAAVLDGDTLRAGLNENLGFSDDDRRENVRRVAHVARLLSIQGLIVLVSVITPRRDLRALAAQIAGPGFLEIFVRASYATCAARDPKGLYKRAEDGRLAAFTGRDSAFEEPESPDLILDTEARSLEDCVTALLACAHTAADPSHA